MPGTPAWAQDHGVAGGAGRRGLEKSWGAGRPSRWTAFMDTGSGTKVVLGLKRKARG